MKHPDDIKKFILQELPRHPSDIVTVAAKQFHCSRQAAHKHLKQLVASGKVTQTGTTKAARYFLTSANQTQFTTTIRTGLSEDDIWRDHLAKHFSDFAENVQRICQYGFTEMFNNVIDHSTATRAVTTFEIKKGSIHLSIHDNGVGIYRKIQAALNLDDPREALLHLTKGKFTTDPSRHSGEGIFFTSRAFDTFILSSGTTTFIRHAEDDWLLKTDKKINGTLVILELAVNSSRTLEDLFKRYTDAETFSFAKTKVVVALSQKASEPYISRSQAKRILSGLDKFKDVVLDFKDVPTVGQAFVDEVFRVFQNQHPEIKIRWVNAGPDVDFMIRRGLG